MTQFDESLLKRYRGLVGLAERGEGGEKTNASRLVSRMRKKHPGIHAAAFAPPPEEEPFIPPPSPPGDTLRDIFDRVMQNARSGAAWAAGAAYEALKLQTAAEEAEEVEIRTKDLASGKWQVAVKIPHEDLEEMIQGYSDEQADTYATTVAERVRIHILEVLGYEFE